MIKGIFYFKDGSVTIHKENAEKVVETFLPGLYTVEQHDKGPSIWLEEFGEIHTPFSNQKYTIFMDSLTKFLQQENRDICNELGFNYKLNTLFYGKQGTGKTSVMNYAAKHLIEKHGALVFMIHGWSNLHVTVEMARAARKIQDNLIIYMIDEFDQLVRDKKEEAYLKSFLDGVLSINNSLVFATTNYLDHIPNTIKERPSRFRLLLEIEAIDSPEIVKRTIKTILDKTKKEIFTAAEIDAMSASLASKGVTIDEIKNYITDKIMNLSIGITAEPKIGFVKEEYRLPEKKQEPEFDSALEKFIGSLVNAPGTAKVYVSEIPLNDSDFAFADEEEEEED